MFSSDANSAVQNTLHGCLKKVRIRWTSTDREDLLKLPRRLWKFHVYIARLSYSLTEVLWDKKSESGLRNNFLSLSLFFNLPQDKFSLFDTSWQSSSGTQGEIGDPKQKTSKTDMTPISP